LAKRLCVRKSAASSEQVNKEQALTHDDVGGIQVSADFEEMFEVEIGKINHSKLINSLFPGHLPILHVEVVEDAGSLSWPTMAPNEHGSYLRYLHEDPSPA
jgi:hypothetical protein